MKSGRPEGDSARRPGALASSSSHQPRKSWASSALPVLFVRRERWMLTWPGRLLMLAVVTSIALVGARNLCAFLAITSPVGGEFLVVEGWMPTYAYREAVTE